MSRLIPVAVVTAAVVAIATAGCGNAGASGPGAANGAASVVPADAVAFVTASTDLTSSQWHAVTGILLKKVEAQANLSWANDVRPALGSEVDVAVLPGRQVVAFAQPDDSAKLDALATRYKVQTRTIGGWTAVAKTASALDDVANATSHLADSNVFVDAMGRLPADALVRAYANGSGTTMGDTGFEWFAASLTGTTDGLKLAGFGHPAAGAPSPGAPYAPALVDRIPSGALAVLDFRVPAQGFALLQKLLGAGATGVPKQLGTLLGGETALYVRPGLPIPEVTLVTEPADTAAASQALDDLLGALPKAGMFSNVELHRAVVDGRLVVSTTQQGIDEYRSSGPKLSADPSFLEAKKQSGMPAEVSGLAYVNVKDVLPLLQLAGLQLPAGMPDLRTFAAYGGTDGGDLTFTAFLGVG
jgi:hypothetical protein